MLAVFPWRHRIRRPVSNNSRAEPCRSKRKVPDRPRNAIPLTGYSKLRMSGRKRHKLLRPLAAKRATEQIDKIVPYVDGSWMAGAGVAGPRRTARLASRWASACSSSRSATWPGTANVGPDKMRPVHELLRTSDRVRRRYKIEAKLGLMPPLA